MQLVEIVCLINSLSIMDVASRGGHLLATFALSTRWHLSARLSYTSEKPYYKR